MDGAGTEGSKSLREAESKMMFVSTRRGPAQDIMTLVKILTLPIYAPPSYMPHHRSSHVQPHQSKTLKLSIFQNFNLNQLTLSFLETERWTCHIILRYGVCNTSLECFLNGCSTVYPENLFPIFVLSLTWIFTSVIIYPNKFVGDDTARLISLIKIFNFSHNFVSSFKKPVTGVNKRFESFFDETNGYLYHHYKHR